MKVYPDQMLSNPDEFSKYSCMASRHHMWMKTVLGGFDIAPLAAA